MQNNPVNFVFLNFIRVMVLATVFVRAKSLLLLNFTYELHILKASLKLH